jgi:hypothetical protein
VTDGLALPLTALEYMNEEPPTRATLDALGGLAPVAFEALVRALEHRELLDHLELLAELSAAGKDTKKAAGAAAYRLRSRGVKPRFKAPPAPQPDVKKAEPVDLGFVALASAPGLVGRYWMLLGTLPGVEALEVKGDADGGVEGIEVIRPVSGSKLERLAKEFERKTVRGLPVRASADLALQLVASWASLLPAGRVPPLWREVDAWRQAALGLGADAARASARRQVAASVTPLSWEALYKLEAGGIHLPTPAVLQRVLAGMRDMLDKPSVEAEVVERHARDLSRESLAGWLSVPEVRERLRVFLDATADVMLGVKQVPAAAAFLALADVLGREPDGYTLVEHPFFTALRSELLGRDVRGA